MKVNLLNTCAHHEWGQEDKELTIVFTDLAKAFDSVGHICVSHWKEWDCHESLQIANKIYIQKQQDLSLI